MHRIDSGEVEDWFASALSEIVSPWGICGFFIDDESINV